MNVQKTGLSILLLQIIMLGSKLDSRKFNFGTLGPRPPPFPIYPYCDHNQI